MLALMDRDDTDLKGEYNNMNQWILLLLFISGQDLILTHV